MERIIDLHIHTTCSDGSLTPKQVIDIASKNNVNVISIADHDSIEAYSEDIWNLAKNNNIRLIQGVEISTRFNNVGVHVLGYNFDPTNAELISTLDKLKNARQTYLIDVSNKLTELGYEVDVQKLKTISSVTKAHISQDVISNKNNESLLLKTFGHIPSKGEFIETIMNENCPAFVEKFSISPTEATKIIHNAGGIAILAHPVAYKHEDGLESEQILDLINKTNVDGIESNYIYVNRFNEIINETAFWNDFAFKNNLLITAGSDFHISDGLHPDIGFLNTSFKLTENQIENILNNINKKA